MKKTEVRQKKGRPRQFDVNQALSKAIHVFWRKGYEGASLNDLTTEMGISGPSLYSAFGSKHELFIKAVEAYTKDNNCKPIMAFEAESDIKKAVRYFFKEVINDSLENSKGTTGCFLSSCVATSAAEHDDVKDLLRQAIFETEKRFTRRFELEKEKGVLSPNFPSKKRARMIFDLRQGFAFRARAGLNKEELSKDLYEIVQIILLEP